MSIYNERLVTAARRFALACSCAGNAIPCSKCWEAAEDDVEGYYHAIEEAETRLESKYHQYSETGKKLEP